LKNNILICTFTKRVSEVIKVYNFDVHIRIIFLESQERKNGKRMISFYFSFLEQERNILHSLKERVT